MDIKAFLKTAPNKPGVYIMKSDSDNILYIGKAANLKNRLSSYFRKTERLEPKIKIMLSKMHNIDFKICSSETEALIIESELIKKFRPRYNTLGRDDKSFPWIKITKDDFPLVCVSRPKIKEDAVFIGPFTSAYLLRLALKSLRGILQFRSCFKIPKKACLNYSLGLCPAPCIFKISKTEYQHNIANLRQILEGRTKKIIKQLATKMYAFSRERRFEEAAILRDQVQALETLWKENAGAGTTSVLWQLKAILNLKRLPLRIEGVDISNIAGNQNVGSLVSFYKTLPDKDQYRRYRIKSVTGADDYKSILEIFRRRFERVKQGEIDKPDLIVVDGGKGQLSIAKRALNEIGLSLPVISIAKKKEHIFLPDKSEPLILPKDSKALQLIQQVRNEAHRFALKYHRLLRKKNMLKSKIYEK
jgi:excinuclease ABC subunit C